MIKFKNAPLDNFAKIMTVAISISVLAVGFYGILYEVSNLPVLASILALVLLISTAFIPKIFVENNNLTIKNLFSKTTVPLSEIAEVKSVKGGGDLRSFGIGGVFGYFGKFNGSEKWFVTNTNKMIKIKTINNKIFAVSPENTQEFINELNKVPLTA